MTEVVPADEIEGIVGWPRHATRHYARAVSAERQVYVLHSQQCFDTRPDLNTCMFSVALENGIDQDVWKGLEDTPVRVTIWRDKKLRPVERIPLGDAWPR